MGATKERATEPKLTAAQLILLAAYEVAMTKDEFSEWALTVRVWERNPVRFGLRGYEKKHPDHKRVSCEMTATQSKPGGVVRRGYLKKTKPNHYKLTALGKAEAERLLKPGSGPRVVSVYERLAPYFQHFAFAAWLENFGKPDNWPDAALFLDAGPGSSGKPTKQLKDLRELLTGTLRDCRSREADGLAAVGRGSPIAVGDMAAMLDFLTALEYRFPFLKDHAPKVSA